LRAGRRAWSCWKAPGGERPRWGSGIWRWPTRWPATCGAARLFGFWVSASNALRVTREFTEQTTYDRLCAILDERLSASERAALVATGSAFSLHDAIVEARATRAQTEPAIAALGIAAVNRQGVNA
jgi:hypothetical protein